MGFALTDITAILHYLMSGWLDRGAAPLRLDAALIRVGGVALTAPAPLLPALAAQLRSGRPRPTTPKPKLGPGPPGALSLPAWLLPARLEISLPLLRCSLGAALSPDLSTEPVLAGGARGVPADPDAEPNPDVGAWAELRDMRLTGAALPEAAAAEGRHARTAKGEGGGGAERHRSEKGGDDGGGGDSGEPVPAYRGALTAGALQVSRVVLQPFALLVPSACHALRP